MKDYFEIGNKRLKSRLFMGTGKFSNNNLIPGAIEASNTEVVTVALRRMDFASKDENILNHVPENIVLLPNTSGARNADEAVRIAKIARAAGCGDWVKIEVISDNKYLLPDNYETLKATEILVKEGFKVFPYMSPDLMVAKRLYEVGASAVMPLGSPIGTNRGIKMEEIIQILIEEIDLPIIVDAGIGKPSQAAYAMEMGASAVLVNTAIAGANDPILMAKAFGDAVQAGRNAYIAGAAREEKLAVASSPLTGFLNNGGDNNE